MQSRTESTTIEFTNGNSRAFDKPVKKYIVDFGEYADIVEATNMSITDMGIVFENVIIRTNGGVRIGVGRTFIEHGQVVGATLIEEEFGGIVINNDTKLGLFSVINDG